MNKEEIKQFENEQLSNLLKELKDIDKFAGFSNGAFKYELGKYQASLLLDYIDNLKQALNEIREFINKFHTLQRSTYENQHILQIIDKYTKENN